MPEAVAEPAGRSVGVLGFPRTGSTGARSLAPSAVGYVSVAAGAVVWTAAVSALAIWRHHHFLSHRFDLGNMVQAVWSTAHGRPLEMTDGTTGEQIVRLAAHVDPILLLAAPLWLVHPAPETLIVAFVAVIASGVYPVVRLALKHTGSATAAALLGAWYLCIPWVVWLALNELNPSTLALPLLLYAVWFLDEERLWLFALVAALALACGELIGLTVAALGVWYALRSGRRSVGLAIATVGAGWTALCLAVVVPAFNDGESSRYYGGFETVGGSPGGLAQTAVADPGTLLAQMASTGDLRYALLLALPTAFLFLGQPLFLAAAVPQLALNLVSDLPATVSPVYRYAAPVLAVLVAATVMGVGRFPERFRVPVAGFPVAFAVIVLVTALPVPGAEDYLFPERESRERRAAMREAVELVPSGAPVTVTNRLGAHVSAREVVHLFPARTGADWAVLDTRDPSNSASWFGDVSFERRLEALRSDSAWKLVFARDGILVFRRSVGSDA